MLVAIVTIGFGYAHARITSVNMDDTEELKKRIVELERMVAELRVNELVKLTTPFVAGAGGTNGYITVNVQGRMYKIMTTA